MSMIADPDSGSSVIQRILDCLVVDGPVTDVRIGTHWTVVVVQTPGGSRAGLAATQFGEGGEHGRSMVSDAGQLLGKTGAELAALALSESATERSLGIAAVNALLEVPTGACVDESAEEVILRNGRQKRVAIVGHFPFVGRVRREAQECWVLELEPGPEDLPASSAPEIIPQADVVAITGMSLVNRSFLGLVQLCRPDAYVLLLGPSTPLSPVLFDYGVSALSGTVVVDVPAIVTGVSQGATFRQLTGRRLVTMESKTRATSAGPRPRATSTR
jgi:uncharacterized protein